MILPKARNRCIHLIREKCCKALGQWRYVLNDTLRDLTINLRHFELCLTYHTHDTKNFSESSCSYPVLRRKCKYSPVPNKRISVLSPNRRIVCAQIFVKCFCQKVKHINTFISNTGVRNYKPTNLKSFDQRMTYNTLDT